MRLARFDLTKFGMFSDTSLDLLPDGVNVVVGANEAGKTTTMAAIHQLLYGIPVRSDHSYMHANSDLRVGGLLYGNDGAELEVYRIKRNTGTLRTATDTLVSDDALSELLGGVGADIYATLFSISHAEIVSGGQALLKSEGELGRALFGAGTGLTQLNAVMAKLDKRAGELFKSGASKPLINDGIARYKHSLTDIKEHTQSASAVEQLGKTLEKAEQRLGQIEKDHRVLSSELNCAERVRSTRAQIQRRRQGRQELAALESLGPRVAPEIPALLAPAQDERRAGASRLATLGPDLEALEGKLADLVVDEELVAQAEVVERLVEELGGIRQNLKDLPSLNKQVGDLERDLDGLLRRVPAGCRSDSEGMPSISDVEQSRIERLGKEKITIDSALSASRLLRDATKRDERNHASDLNALPVADDVSRLRPTAARIRAEGQLETAADDLQQQVALLQSKIEATVSELRVTIDARDADKLAVPAAVRVNEIDEDVATTRTAVASALAEDNRLKAELADVDSQLSGLLQNTDPPSLDELDHARIHRDEGWYLVRAAWLENASHDDQVRDWTEGKPLAQAYETAVEKTDQIADRLRREAEAVERRASLEQQGADKRTSIDQHAHVIKARQEAHDYALERWRELWAPLGIEAGSRAAMDGFMAKARELATDAANLRGHEGSLAHQRGKIQRCIHDLRGLLHEVADKPADSLNLVALLERAELICASSDSTRQERLLAEQALNSSRASLKVQNDAVTEGENLLGSWELEWAEAVAPLGVPAATNPSDVTNLLSTLKRIEDTSAELDEKRRRVAGMERRNSDIDQQVAEVLTALPHLAVDSNSAEVTINFLQRLLKIALKDATTRTSLLQQRDLKGLAVDQAAESVKRADADIAGLIAQAGVADELALVEAVERTNRAMDLVSDVDELEADLIDATGVSLEQLETDVDRFADTDLDSLISDLSIQRDELDSERTEVALDVGGLRNDRKSIDDSDEAAAAAERSQLTLSEVAAYTDEYVRVMLARYLLEQQIAEYRDRNQGPILARASEIFSQLTLEKYSGIDVDADEKGQPMIHAKQGSGGSLDVTALSTGARDQLYLSLRIAALEHYATGSRNLPLLLDDLFVHFDDDRTKAGLRVMEQLSSKMQVLLFTHHVRVAEQATEAISKGKLRVLTLAT